MTRVAAVLAATVLTASLGITAAGMAQPKPYSAQPTLEQKVEGTIRSVRGDLVTLEDGTELSVPSSIRVAKDELKPGAQISAEYEARAGKKIARSIRIKG